MQHVEARGGGRTDSDCVTLSEGSDTEDIAYPGFRFAPPGAAVASPAARVHWHRPVMSASDHPREAPQTQLVGRRGVPLLLSSVLPSVHRSPGAMPTPRARSRTIPRPIDSVGGTRGGPRRRHASSWCPIPLASTVHLEASRICNMSKLGVGDGRIRIASPSPRVLILKTSPTPGSASLHPGLQLRHPLRGFIGIVLSCPPPITHAKRCRPNLLGAAVCHCS
jgi:hypothetical protein